MWLRHGECLNSLGELTAAVEAYATVVNLAPSHSGARVTLSTLQQQLGRHEEALETLEHGELYNLSTCWPSCCLPLHIRGFLCVVCHFTQDVSYVVSATSHKMCRMCSLPRHTRCVLCVVCHSTQDVSYVLSATPHKMCLICCLPRHTRCVLCVVCHFTQDVSYV